MNTKLYLKILYTVTAIVVLFCICRGFDSMKAGNGFKISLFGSSIGISSNNNNYIRNDVVDDFKAVRLDTNVADVKFVHGEENKVKYAGTKSIEPVVRVENGVLIITQPDDDKIKNKNGEITIICKEKKLEAFYMEGNVGACDIDDGFSFDEMHVVTNVGEIKFDGITVAGDTYLNTNVGEINIKNCNLKDTKIIANVGDVSIRDSYKGTESFEISGPFYEEISLFGTKYKGSANISGEGATVRMSVDVGKIKIR